MHAPSGTTARVCVCVCVRVCLCVVHRPSPQLAQAYGNTVQLLTMHPRRGFAVKTTERSLKDSLVGMEWVRSELLLLLTARPPAPAVGTPRRSVVAKSFLSCLVLGSPSSPLSRPFRLLLVGTQPIKRPAGGEGRGGVCRRDSRC